MSAQLRKELGERIRLLREQQGLSQSVLASMVNMDRGYLGRIESGTCNPTVDKLESIADGLGVSLSFMMRGIGESKPKQVPLAANEYHFQGR